ncbi:unnamed protein product [Orchesella dallaii]|uniref:Uncharacterized protein n=1 Tax=Orchesella dallaii TaxID=48710 RepID=A0ABP1RFW3_9HEXA
MLQEVWSDTDPEQKTDVSKGWMNRDMASSQSVCSSTSSADNNTQTSLSSLENFLFLPQLPVDGDDGDEEAWLFRHHNQEQRQQKRSLASFLTIVKSTKSSRIYNNHHSNQSDDEKGSRKCCAVTTTVPNAKASDGSRSSRSGHSRGCNNSQLCGKSGCPNNSLFSFIAANDTVTTAASTNSTKDCNAEVSKKSQQQPNYSSTRIFIKNSTHPPATIDSSGNSHNNSPFYLAANHHSLLHQPHHHFSRRRLLLFRICQAFSVLICILLLINLVKNSIWVNIEYKNRLVNPIPTSSSLASTRIQNRLIQSWNMPSIISPSSSPHFKVQKILSNSTRNDNNMHNLMLLDVPNFRFLINNKTKCNIPRDDDNYTDDGSNNDGGINSIFFMIIVHSAPKNFEERQAIRKTWGSLQRLGQFHIRLVFLLGHESTVDDNHKSDEIVATTDDESDKGSSIFLKIQQESEKHGDIVTGSFHDSYRNLTYKHLMGYLWVLNHCSHAKYVLKADDDAFIDIFQLFEFLLRTFGLDPEAALICNVFPEGTKPVRQTDIQGKKWAVTYDEYPYESYPKYCGGLAYLATPNVIQEIYRMSHKMKNKYLWIDDVYVTGILRELAHVEPFYLNLRYSYEPEEYRKWLGAVAKNDNEVNDNDIIPQNKKKEGVGVAVLSNRMKNDLQPTPHQKIPFMIVHLERGAQLRREMKDLWNKTMSVWSGSGRII